MNDNPRYTKELPDRPALDLAISVRRKGDRITMEPSPVHGVIGFTVDMSRESALALADALNDAAGVPASDPAGNK